MGERHRRIGTPCKNGPLHRALLVGAMLIALAPSAWAQSTQAARDYALALRKGLLDAKVLPTDANWVLESLIETRLVPAVPERPDTLAYLSLEQMSAQAHQLNALHNRLRAQYRIRVPKLGLFDTEGSKKLTPQQRSIEALHAMLYSLPGFSDTRVIRVGPECARLPNAGQDRPEDRNCVGSHQRLRPDRYSGL
jgi:hypothetical protein